MRLWKRRWFVLADYCLFYYKGELESQSCAGEAGEGVHCWNSVLLLSLLPCERVHVYMAGACSFPLQAPEVHLVEFK